MFMKQGPKLHFITVDTREITTKCYRNLNGPLQVRVGRNAYKIYMCMCKSVHMHVLTHTHTTSGLRCVRCAPVSLSNLMKELYRGTWLVKAILSGEKCYENLCHCCR